jgi:hypothetical protein
MSGTIFKVTITAFYVQADPAQKVRTISQPGRRPHAQPTCYD